MPPLVFKTRGLGSLSSGTGIKSRGLNPFFLRKEFGIRVPSELEFPHSAGWYSRCGATAGEIHGEIVSQILVASTSGAFPHWLEL